MNAPGSRDAFKTRATVPYTQYVGIVHPRSGEVRWHWSAHAWVTARGKCLRRPAHGRARSVACAGLTEEAGSRGWTGQEKCLRGNPPPSGNQKSAERTQIEIGREVMTDQDLASTHAALPMSNEANSPGVKSRHHVAFGFTVGCSEGPGPGGHFVADSGRKRSDGKAKSAERSQFHCSVNPCGSRELRSVFGVVAGTERSGPCGS